MIGAVKEKGFRADAMFYCLSALEKFERMKKEEIQKIAFEIGIKTLLLLPIPFLAIEGVTLCI